ncbi:Myb/SANT-like DNA-binding domain-containing protein [Annulohypoxylon bovei var. microspora]|nr:Myb/SANT-like DNA-binding domain-containing protein [Annulohypoxylon bovei var. microspora]
MSTPIYPRILAPSISFSQAIDSQKTLPGRAKPFCWTPGLTIAVLEQFREQVNNGLKTAAGGLRERGYINVVTVLNKHHNVDVTVKQVKNKFKHLQDKSIVWFSLLAQTGFSWDEETETIQAEDSVWNLYLLSHPEAEVYRERPIEHRRLIEDVFRRKSRATGDLAIGLAATAAQIEATFESRKRKSLANQDDDVPCPRRRKSRETNGALVKEALDNVASSMLQVEILAQRNEQDLRKALKILNQTYLEEISEEAVLRVVDAWAKKDRLATIFIGLNDSFRLAWLKRFEKGVEQLRRSD